MPERLEELMLGRNGIGAAGVSALADVLGRRRRVSLRLLSLHANRLRDDAIEPLAHCLGSPAPQGNRSLQSLDLSGNKLGTRGLLMLGDALVANNSLTALHLGGNTRIAADALAAIEELLKENRAILPTERDDERDERDERDESWVASHGRVEPSVAAKGLVRRDVLELYSSAMGKVQGIVQGSGAHAAVLQPRGASFGREVSITREGYGAARAACRADGMHADGMHADGMHAERLRSALHAAQTEVGRKAEEVAALRDRLSRLELTLAGALDAH